MGLSFSYVHGETLPEISQPQQSKSIHLQVISLQQRQAKSNKKQLRSKATKKKSAKSQTQQEPDSPDRWPTQVPAPRNMRLKEVKAKKGDEGKFFYETNNFSFKSEVQLSEDAQESIGSLFECAFAANRAIARVLPLVRAKSNRTFRRKLKATLFADNASYLASGASEGSSGYFTYSFSRKSSNNRRKVKLKEKMIRNDSVMIPLSSIGISAEGELESKTVNSHTLVHEITHQCTCLNQLSIWANEGISEYVAYVPYDGKILDFDGCFKIIIAGAKRRQPVLNFPFSLEEFFMMDQQEFYKHMQSGSDTYYLSVLCVSYFIHLQERIGVKNFKAYLSRLYKGYSYEKSLPYLYGRKRDRSILQKDFIKSWKEFGINIQLKEHRES